MLSAIRALIVKFELSDFQYYSFDDNLPWADSTKTILQGNMIHVAFLFTVILHPEV